MNIRSFEVVSKSRTLLPMKIHIFGASGSGVSTVGQALSQRIRVPYFDSDDYFWELSELPYTQKRPPDIRNQMLITDLKKCNNWILGGSLTQWGNEFFTLFDLAVFLWIPSKIRIERLKKREYERFGEKNFTDEHRSKQYKEFIVWASGYDNNSVIGRTLQLHEEFLQKVNCETLELRGEVTTEQRIDCIIEKMKTMRK